MGNLQVFDSVEATGSACTEFYIAIAARNPFKLHLGNGGNLNENVTKWRDIQIQHSIHDIYVNAALNLGYLHIYI